jgi:hypothetical protein
MSAPFAALEARAADACIRHLANVTVSIDWATVDGIFDSPRADAFGVVIADDYTLQVADTVTVSKTSSVELADGRVFRVIDMASNAGMHTLTLRKSS